MNNRKLKLMIVQALVLMLPLSAQAKCNYSLSLQLGSYSFNSGTQQQLNITVSKSGGACNYFLTASKGASSTYNRYMSKGSSQIPYELYTGYPFNFVWKDIPEANNTNDVLSGSFASGNKSATTSYWAVLGASAYLPWGYYSDTVTIKLYDGTVTGRNSLVTSQSMLFSYNEPKQIDLSLVPSGSSFDATRTSMLLNFGTLTQNESLGFDVVVMYNAGYQLSIASTGAGQMLDSAAPTSGVPYTLTANGIPANLSGGQGSPSVIANGSGAAPTGGARIPIAITIGSTSKALAGTYSDVLFLVVTSTE